jgi:hypothetical protein
MKKIRRFLAVIALLAATSGPVLPAIGSMANAASSQHASSALAVAPLTKSHVIKPYPFCPHPGWDC